MSTRQGEHAPATRRYFLRAIAAIVLFTGGLLAWSAGAPLATAALAPGVVRVEGNHRSVQHFEGGIVAELAVREGLYVTAGETLLRLTGTRAEADFDALNATWISMKSREARLLAELNGRDEIEWPEVFTEKAELPAVIQAIAGQQRIFTTQRQNLATRRAILAKQIRQLQIQIEGFEGQVAANQRQRSIMAEEIADSSGLFKKGLIRKQEYDEKRRQAAFLDGNLSELQASIAAAVQRIGETDIQILNLTDRLLSETARDLRSTQDELVLIEERLRTATDIRARLEIKAPISGKVQNLQIFTQGGVIAPGQTLMDIVPDDERLIVEAETSPLDIDVIRPGLQADIRLSAYRQRTMPPVRGEVIDVSADRIDDASRRTSYYLARIAILPGELEKLEDVSLYPGMPAEVMIETGTETLFGYLTAPIADLLRRGLREE